MTGEALNRRYHELCGWTFHDESWHNPLCPAAVAACRMDLPPLHLDANLAIAEADRVFGPHWTIDRHSHGFEVNVFNDDEQRIQGMESPKAETACSAILTALIAAKESK